MKEGWEYKKLGAVADFYRGLTYKREDEVDSSDNCVLRSNNIDLESMSLNFDELKYIKQDFIIPEEKKLKANSVFVCMSNGSKQHVGKVAYIKDNMDYAFGGFMGLIVPKRVIEGKYIYYICRSSLYRQFLTQIGNGIGITNLRFTDLNNFSLPVPSISEQRHIIEELDLLTSIIERKKVQLMELDNLAQSLFYEMFGNPFTNEKEWEVKIIGDCFSYIKNGANIKQTKGASGYPITRIETLSNGVFNRDRLGYANICDLTKYTNYVLNDGDLLMSHINSKAYIGRTVMYKKEDEEQIIHGMNLLRLVVVYDLLIPTFADYYFKTEYFKDEVAKIRKDAVNQSSMAIGDLRMIRIFLPPLALQQQFASNIEAIERQKKLIKQSIKEVETLFNSRMDYYFN